MRTLLISLLGILLSPLLCADEPKPKHLSVGYELLDSAAFQQKVVGNTVVGITPQSKSLYMVYFAKGGVCELWKAGQIYVGKWWIDRDANGQDAVSDVVHAFWPEYQSTQPKSLFHPENQRFGNATSVWYYASIDQPNALMLLTKSAQGVALIVPGRQLG